MPSTIPDRSPPSTIPEANFTPVTPREDDTFRLPNTNRSPAPKEPSSREPGADSVEPVLPLGTGILPAPQPLDLPPEPARMVKVERRRVVLEAVTPAAHFEQVPSRVHPLPMADTDLGLVLR
jgi:hypothetical protein